MDTKQLCSVTCGREKILASSANDPALILASATVQSATLRGSVMHADIFGPADCSPGQAFENIC